MTPKRSADDTIWNEDHWADADVHPALDEPGADEPTAAHGAVAPLGDADSPNASASRGREGSAVTDELASSGRGPGGDDGEFAHVGTHEPLPPRPRRRLATPAALVPLAVILVAGGFAGGVEVQKHRGGSATSGAPAGFAARTGGTSAAGGFGNRSGSTGAGSAGAASGSSTASAGTSGTVANVKGGTIYVTTTSGSTVRVVAADGATVQRTAKATMTGVHPGDTVVVTGTTKSDGTVSATAVTATASGVTATGGFGGGGFPGGGFPGSGGTRSSGGTSTGSASSGG